jgi:hypothetical protein
MAQYSIAQYVSGLLNTIQEGRMEESAVKAIVHSSRTYCFARSSYYIYQIVNNLFDFELKCKYEKAVRGVLQYIVLSAQDKIQLRSFLNDLENELYQAEFTISKQLVETSTIKKRKVDAFLFNEDIPLQQHQKIKVVKKTIEDIIETMIECVPNQDFGRDSLMSDANEDFQVTKTPSTNHELEEEQEAVLLRSLEECTSLAALLGSHFANYLYLIGLQSFANAKDVWVGKVSPLLKALKISLSPSLDIVSVTNQIVTIEERLRKQYSAVWAFLFLFSVYTVCVRHAIVTNLLEAWYFNNFVTILRTFMKTPAHVGVDASTILPYTIVARALEAFSSETTYELFQNASFQDSIFTACQLIDDGFIFV